MIANSPLHYCLLPRVDVSFLSLPPLHNSHHPSHPHRLHPPLCSRHAPPPSPTPLCPPKDLPFSPVPVVATFSPRPYSPRVLPRPRTPPPPPPGSRPSTSQPAVRAPGRSTTLPASALARAFPATPAPMPTCLGAPCAVFAPGRAAGTASRGCRGHEGSRLVWHKRDDLIQGKTWWRRRWWDTQELTALLGLLGRGAEGEGRRMYGRLGLLMSASEAF